MTSYDMFKAEVAISKYHLSNLTVDKMDAESKGYRMKVQKPPAFPLCLVAHSAVAYARTSYSPIGRNKVFQENCYQRCHLL